MPRKRVPTLSDGRSTRRDKHLHARQGKGDQGRSRKRVPTLSDGRRTVRTNKQQIAIENASWSKGDQGRSREIAIENASWSGPHPLPSGQSDAIRGPSEAIRGHQTPSDAIRHHSDTFRRNHAIRRHSDAIMTPSDAIPMHSDAPGAATSTHRADGGTSPPKRSARGHRLPA